MSQSNRLPDMRARDIRRRIEVIQKKLSYLQELNIPCAFCYSSVRNTGSLFTLGDRRITDVVEKHKNEILKNLIENKSDSTGERRHEIHLILPPLPAPLGELNRSTMQSLIVGILKDLGIKWSDPKPQWWPMDVPFFSPRSVPDSFKGNWTQALRRVVESVYSFFSYDINTYIAGNLEIYEEDEHDGKLLQDGEGGEERRGGKEGREKGEGGGEGESGTERWRGGEREGGEGGEGRIERDREEERKAGQMAKGEEVEEETQEEGEVEGIVDDDEETDDALSGAECDTSTEEDAFEDGGIPGRSKVQNGSLISLKTCPGLDKTKVFPGRHSSSRNHSSKSLTTTYAHKPSINTLHTVDAHSLNTPTSKAVSSFTVENILMGSTSRSNSTSSGSPTSASHTANTSFLPLTPHGSSSSSASMPLSPSSANWTSHPPVKYTKFTMMSPLSMRNGGDKKKKGERNKTLSTSGVELNHQKLQVPKLQEGMHQVSKCKEEPRSPAPSSPAVRMPSSSTHHVQHPPPLTYHHSVIQTAIPAVPLTRQSSAQSAGAAASPHIVSMSPNPVTPFPRVETHSPHQQQQYVVFFPPNLTLMTAPANDLQVVGQANSSQLYVQSSVQQPTNHGRKGPKHTSPYPSSSSTSPPPSRANNISGSTSLSNAPCLTPAISNSHTSTLHKITDPRYHPIAPRAENQSHAPQLHNIGAKSRVPADNRTDGTRSAPKQKKLRFHMTTVVKKARRRSSSVSLTAPPPTLCDRSPPHHNKHREADDTSSLHDSNNTNVQLTTSAQVNHTNHSPIANTRSSNGSPPSEKSTVTDIVKLPSSGSKTTKVSPLSTDNPSFSNTTKQRDSEACLSSLSLPSSVATDTTLSSPTQSPPGRGRGRGRGRRGRGYTRRKRELTFHLYEDPYRAKRTRQHN